MSEYILVVYPCSWEHVAWFIDGSELSSRLLTDLDHGILICVDPKFIRSRLFTSPPHLLSIFIFIPKSIIMTISISKLFLYPIKSCRGIQVDSAEITPLGFKNDRAYMLVEVKPPKPDSEDSLKAEKWIPMTLRGHPKVSIQQNTANRRWH